MTEKQPDWIKQKRKWIDRLLRDIWYTGTRQSLLIWDVVLRQYLEKHLDHLPQESTYESGYQKGKEEMESEVKRLQEIIDWISFSM